MKLISSLIVLILSFNCVAQQNLSENKTFKKVFSEKELHDIEVVFEFFNRAVCKDTENLSLDSCYKKFLFKISRQIPDGNIDFGIDYKDQKKLYESFDTATFNTLWEYNMMWHIKKSEDTMRYMTYKHDGEFIRFLKKFGKKNKAVNHYYENFISAGDISPSTSTGILMNYEYYNISDIRTKFLIAMHCLTLNDQWNREERY